MRFVLSLVTIMLALALTGPVTAQDRGIGAAFAAASEGDWALATSLAAAEGDIARDLIEWARLREGEGTYQDALVFLASRPGWPGLNRVRAEAERVIPEDLPPADVIAFFEGRDLPETGAGVLALARAYEATGQAGEEQALVVQAWLTLSMEPLEQETVAANFSELLAPHHAARADMLLWRWKRSEAELLLPLLDDEQAALVAARIALIRGDRNAEDMLAAVPPALAETTGLLYDRYSWLAAKGRRTEALAILQSVNGSAEALGDPFRWSGWRRTLARWVLSEGDAQRAYDLAARHWLSPEDGTAFADLEWLAGWIALRSLDNPELALDHFRTLAEAVDGPISRARAQYWMGRTYEVIGDADNAQIAYSAGAEHQTAFYGLLSAERLGRPLDPRLVGGGPVIDWREADVISLDTVEAGRILLESGERGLAVLFFRDLGRTLEAPQLEILGQLLDEMGEDYFVLLLGKSAAARGMILPRLLHPVHALAETDLPVEPALALSVARQESEFRADAGSPVGALGLMQLMPATAEEIAGELGLPYSRGRLTSDWEYNAALGARYLANLQDEFGPSPVMIAAGYNAGPSRPRLWMDDRGDPRLGEAEIIDWIEMIPFRETRNYVMRVTEAIPIYRARLSGDAGPIRFTEMLVGEKPVVRPVARPAAAADPAQIRPVARPGE